MNDVVDRLARLAPASAPEMDATQDLVRGRTARTRRRTRRAGLAVGGLALAVAATYGVVATGEDPRGTQIQLVAWTGGQLPGFTVEKVPEGFVLQGASAHVLALAKPGDVSSIDDFEEKLVVMLEADEPPAPAPGGDESLPRLTGEDRVVVQDDGAWLVTRADGSVVAYRPSPGEEPADVEGLLAQRDERDNLETESLGESQVESQPSGKPVTVNGEAGTIVKNGEGTRTLKYDHGEFRVVIQMWPTLGLTDAQLVEFAEGVTVTADARPSVG